MRHRTTLLSAALTAAVTVLVAACADATGPATRGLSPGGGPSFEKADKVTICHAAGRDGTTHYVSINVSGNAGYTPHLNDNGTTRAGHEDDYLLRFGSCGDGQLEVCVAYIPGQGETEPYVPPFAATLTAGSVFSRLYSGIGLLECSGAIPVAAGVYTVDHPAPGTAEVGGVDNGTWFITSVGVAPSANGLSASPAFNTTWDDDFGRGRAGWAQAKVVVNGSTVVTFTDTK